MNLTELARKHGSDKGEVKPAHRYTLLYDLLFLPMRDRKIRLLEMGLQVGGPELGKDAGRSTTKLPSVQMWLDYFPEAEIMGLDISDFSWFQDPRFSFVQCDMEMRENIREVAAGIDGQLDVIIDDASHASHHQQFAFLEMWPKLKNGGLYIIEDLHWQPAPYEREGFTKTGDFFNTFQAWRRFEHVDPQLQAEFTALGAEMGFVYVFPHQYRRRKGFKILVVQKTY